MKKGCLFVKNSIFMPKLNTANCFCQVFFKNKKAPEEFVTVFNNFQFFQ